MSKVKSLIALALVAATGLAHAQTATSNVSTSTLGSAYRSLKEGPLDLSFNLAVDATRNGKTNEVNGVKHTDIAYLGYRMTSNDSIRLENRWTVANEKNKESDATFARTVLSYKRSNILTEATHGVGMSAQLEKRYIPDAVSRAAGNTYGLNRISATAVKNIGPVSLANTLYFAATDVRNKADQSTARNYLYGVFTQSLNLPADMSLSLTEEIFKDNNNTNEEEFRNVVLTAELGKQFTPDIYLGASIAGEPVANTLDWGSDAKWVSKFTYGINLNIVAF